MFRIIKSRKAIKNALNKKEEGITPSKTFMTLEDILNEFSLDVEKWHEHRIKMNTNCLSFAMGLPIPYQNISFSYAYECGGFYQLYHECPMDISTLKGYEKLELDFDILGYSYEEVDINEKISKDQWKIALFQDYSKEQLFHVYRQTENGIWYHKIGFPNEPTNLDNNGNIITNPINSNKEIPYQRYANLEYQKTYCLRRNR